MKLIQANIWGGKLEYQIPEFLNAEQPDIVCMQEVHDLPGASGAVFVTLDELQQKCGFKHRYMSACYTSHYQRRQNNFGNAIISKLALENSRTVFTYGKYNPDFDLTQDEFNVRNLQQVEVTIGAETLYIFNHHGWLNKGSKLGNDETLRQMKIILAEIQKVSGPVILTGDFNLAPESESIQLLSSGLRNLAVEFGLQSTYTQFSSNQVVCDYIFVNDQINVIDFNTSTALISDHKPLILEFTL